MYTSADSRFVNTCYIAYKRGRGCLGVTFTLIINESDQTSKDASKFIKVTFDTPNAITTRIGSPYFDISVPEAMNNFVSFATFLHTRISDKIEHIVENIKLRSNQQLCSIIVSGKSHTFNEEEDNMDQSPFSFVYTHVIDEPLSYEGIKDAIGEHFRLNIPYFDEYLSEVERDYVRDYKSAEIRKSRAKNAHGVNVESE